MTTTLLPFMVLFIFYQSFYGYIWKGIIFTCALFHLISLAAHLLVEYHELLRLRPFLQLLRFKS